ncbi:hypothetical protein DB29_03236 [Shouchella clausii]|nr:hypothetical protein DB29_03236 [Shouchella clausii]
MKSEHLFIKNDKGGPRLKTARAKIQTSPCLTANVSAIDPPNIVG